MTKEMMIDLIVSRESGTPQQLQQMRKTLERTNVDYVEKLLDESNLRQISVEAARQVARSPRIMEIQADRERMAEEHLLSMRYGHIFRTPIIVDGKAVVAIDNAANRGVIAGWPHEDRGEYISAAFFKKVLAEQPQLARSLSWQSVDVLDPKKRKLAEANQEAEDRETFNKFAREIGFSGVEANFQLAKSVLGNFDRYTLAQAVQSNALQLAPASQEELAQYAQDAYEARVDFLAHRATPLELRAAAHQESERLAQGQQQAPELDQIQKMRQAEQNAGTAYPPLPDEFRDGNGPEEALNAAFVKRCSTETLQKLIRIYGSAQIDELLRVRVPGSIWEF